MKRYPVLLAASLFYPTNQLLSMESVDLSQEGVQALYTVGNHPMLLSVALPMAGLYVASVCAAKRYTLLLQQCNALKNKLDIDKARIAHLGSDEQFMPEALSTSRRLFGNQPITGKLAAQKYYAQMEDKWLSLECKTLLANGSTACALGAACGLAGAVYINKDRNS